MVLRVAPLRQEPFADAALELLPESIDPPFVDQKRQPRAIARAPRAVVPEDQRDVAAERRRVLGPAEHVQRCRGPQAARSDLAADRNVEALHFLARDDLDRRRQRQVLRFAVRAVLRAAGNRDVEFARQIRKGLVPEERVVEITHDARGVEQLVVRQPRDGTSDDVPDVVHAGLQRHEVDRIQPLPDMRQVADGKSTQLNLLPRREIDEAGAAFAAQLCNDTDLLRVGEPVRHPNPHHEAAGRLTPEEHAKPLQPLAVGFVNRLPSVAHKSLDVGFDVEAILCRACIARFC